MTTTKKIELYLQNLDCENEAARIEAGLRPVQGLTQLSVFPKAAKVALEFAPAVVTADALKRKLVELGLPEKPRDPDAASIPAPWRNLKVITAALSGLFLLAGWVVGMTGAPPLAQTAVHIIAALVGGYYFGREALEDLFRERRIGIELLMSVAAIAAIALGLPGEGAMLAFLYSISEAAEGYTAEKTRSAIRALMKLAPKTALVRRDGRELEVPVEELKVGEIFLVRPGQAIATDGEVVSGNSSVNQAPITGESVPVEKEPGDKVFVGTLNEQGALDVRVTAAWGDNTLSRIISMVEDAQERKAESERFIARFGRRYSPIVLLVGVIVALVPPLLMSADWVESVVRATVLIVAAAPCALVISIPITMVATLGTAARTGVLIKGGTHVEDLARVQIVAFDKTGTLTVGEPEVTDFVPWPGAAISDDDVLRRAAGLEKKSQHPLARAVVRFVEGRKLSVPEATAFQSLTAAGARAEVDGKTVVAGKPAYFATELKVSIEPMR